MIAFCIPERLAEGLLGACPWGLFVPLHVCYPLAATSIHKSLHPAPEICEDAFLPGSLWLHRPGSRRLKAASGLTARLRRLGNQSCAGTIHQRSSKTLAAGSFLKPVEYEHTLRVPWPAGRFSVSDRNLKRLLL